MKKKRFTFLEYKSDYVDTLKIFQHATAQLDKIQIPSENIKRFFIIIPTLLTSVPIITPYPFSQFIGNSLNTSCFL